MSVLWREGAARAPRLGYVVARLVETRPPAAAQRRRIASVIRDIGELGEHLRMGDRDVMRFVCMTVSTPEKAVALYTYKGRRFRWIHEGAGPGYWVAVK